MNVKILKSIYKPGTYIELINMEGEANYHAGDRGRVEFVDDAGQIHVSWNKGGSLALIPGLDSFTIIEVREPQNAYGERETGE